MLTKYTSIKETLNSQVHTHMRVSEKETLQLTGKTEDNDFNREATRTQR